MLLCGSTCSVRGRRHTDAFYVCGTTAKSFLYHTCLSLTRPIPTEYGRLLLLHLYIKARCDQQSNCASHTCQSLLCYQSADQAGRWALGADGAKCTRFGVASNARSLNKIASKPPVAMFDQSLRHQEYASTRRRLRKGIGVRCSLKFSWTGPRSLSLPTPLCQAP